MNAPQKIATREAYGVALAELGARDERVVVLDADLSGSTKTSVFAKKYPHRFINVGVAEQNLIGIASGLARQGKIPFASTFAVFATGRAFEPVRQQVAYAKLNAKIVASHGGITVGEDGGSHQTVEDLGLMRGLPNMTVLCPGDATETAAMVRAMHEHQGPVYMRTSRLATRAVFGSDFRFVVGRANRVREGSDVTIVTTGIMVGFALEAAQALEAEGIRAGVLHCGCLKPIDAEAISAAARETGALVTAEEHSILNGLGSAVCEVTAEHFPVPVERVGMRDVFGTSGRGEELLDYFGLNAKGIAQAARRAIQRKR